MAGADPAAVLVEAPVKDMVSGLYAPMAAVQLQQALRGGGLRAQAGAVSALLSPVLTSVTSRCTAKTCPTPGNLT